MPEKAEGEMSAYSICARHEPWRGLHGDWTAVVLRDGEDLVLSYGCATEREALRTADGYRDGWLGKTKNLTVVRVDGELGDCDTPYTREMAIADRQFIEDVAGRSDGLVSRGD